MDVLFVMAFAFTVGLTIAGLSGALIELISGRRLSFAQPFVSRERFAVSLLSTVLVGPYMLVNDALEAQRSGQSSMFMLAACLTTASVWLTAAGVVAIDLVLRLSALLS